MFICKITFRTQYLEAQEVYSVRGREAAAIEKALGEYNKSDFPYFVEALKPGNNGYFRGETAELPEKVRAFIEIEDIEVTE